MNPAQPSRRQFVKAASAMAVKAGTTVQEIPGAKVREALAAKGGGPFTEA